VVKTGVAADSKMAEQNSQPIQLVLADVDGTLVTNDKKLTPQAIEEVKRLRARGIRFAITSGRPPRGMRMLIDALQLTDPVAAFNGGIIVKPDLRTVLDEKYLPSECVPGIIDSIFKHKLDAWVYTDSDWFVLNPAGVHVDREQRTVQFPPTVIKTYEGFTEKIVKIVGVSDDYPAVQRAEADVQRDFAGRVSAARSQPYYLDITHPDANKGMVVSALARLLNISEKAIATIGDMPNDVLMFKRSGMSVAMGNASDEVKKQATFVTDSNENEGFAKAMEKYILSQLVTN